MKYIIVSFLMILILSCSSTEKTDLELVPKNSDIILSLDIPRLLKNRTVNFILERKGIKRILEREMDIYLEDLSQAIISQKLSGVLDLFSSKMITLKGKFKANSSDRDLDYKGHKIFNDKNGQKELFTKDKRVIGSFLMIKQVIDELSVHETKYSIVQKNAKKIFKEIDDYPIRMFINLNSSIISQYMKKIVSSLKVNSGKISGYMGVSIDITNDSLNFHIVLISNNLPLDEIGASLEKNLKNIKPFIRRFYTCNTKLGIELENLFKSIKIKKEKNKLDVRISISHRFLGKRVE